MRKFDFHSPVEPLDFPLFREKGLTVKMKRDDLIHPFISGNKWRKLKYIIEEADRLGKTHLVTFGGAWSNHLLATACAGATFGFSTTAFVRGEPVSNPILSLCKLFGMDLRYVNSTAYRDKRALFDAYFGNHPKAQFIDEGGYSKAGAQGCAEIFDELTESYDHICCAVGTGTTLAGLLIGKARKELNTSIHGISVLAGNHSLQQMIENLGAQPPDAELHMAYHFGGYAKTAPVLNQFIAQFCRQTGLLIEPVYTGKLCYGVFDLAAKDFFNRGDNILILHTGGLTGILGMHEQLGFSKAVE